MQKFNYTLYNLSNIKCTQRVLYNISKLDIKYLIIKSINHNMEYDGLNIFYNANYGWVIINVINLNRQGENIFLLCSNRAYNIMCSSVTIVYPKQIKNKLIIKRVFYIEII
jgi:hypothetical protein